MSGKLLPYHSETGRFSRRHFVVTIPLSIVPESESNDESNDFSEVTAAVRQSLESEVGAIQSFVQRLNQDPYAGIFRWNFHDVNYVPGRRLVEVSLIITNYVNNNRSGTSSVGLPHLNSRSPDHWQVRRWTPLYISTTNQHIVVDRQQSNSIYRGVAAFLVINVARTAQWIRGMRGSADSRQPDVEMEVQGRLLGSQVTAGGSGVR